ncbi:MAG: T9SS type A sorting domain-containing protein, partial [Saprospiraceae bacterium]
AEHSEVTGFTVETIIEEGLEKPCGIELFENRLLVGDYETGDIVVYDLENNFEELGRIPTDFEGLTGIKVGPKGNIWYTNREEETLHVASPGEVSSTTNIEEDVTITITPNPTSGLLMIYTTSTNNTEEAVIQVTNTSGQLLMQVQQTATQQRIDLSTFPSGVYIVTVQGESFHRTEKVILAR